ncbi:MAG: tandem-95 repeat protein [Pseudomonadales bacterium]|nr:tandem-95 repeat protein [Pseudomonadales bacterium]
MCIRDSTYSASDGNGGSASAIVSVTVGGVNDAPVAIDDAASTTEEVAVVVNVLANDSDLDGDTLTVSSVTQGANGSVTNNGSDLTYTPNANFNGSDSFTYSVSDGNGGSATATVSVSVGGVNDAPVAIDDAATTSEEVAVVVDVLANDSDLDGDSLTVDSITQGANGSVTNNGSDVTYTPNANYTGVDSFTYSVSDGNGGSATATVSITVGGVNDAPIASDDVASTDEDTLVIIDVLLNDIDEDGDSLTLISFMHGAQGTVVLNADSTLTYTPSENFNGLDSFSYSISDGVGGSDSASVNVNVIPVNDNPSAADDRVMTDEEILVVINVLDNDVDVDGDTLIVSVNDGAGSGSIIVNSDQTLSYTPETDFAGIDSFSYSVSDSHGGTDIATVTVDVGGVNDAPEAISDSVTTDEDMVLTIDVLANDMDADGDSLRVDSVSSAGNGTIVNNGFDVTYTPDTNFYGSDSFSYIVVDDNGGSDTSTVSISVLALNDDPLANDDSVVTNEDMPVSIGVTLNDSDVDGDSLTIDSVSSPDYGVVMIDSDDFVTYTPESNFVGLDTFEYSVSDRNGGSSNAIVTIVVGGINDVPVAVNDDVETDEDVAITILVLENDFDVDGDVLSLVSVRQGTHGTVTNNGTSITYLSEPNFNGYDEFTYTVSDSFGGTAIATVTVFVHSVNDEPFANDDNISTEQDTEVVIDLLANDSDVEGDHLTIESVTDGANGSVVNNGSDVTYSPDIGFSGIDSFTYFLNDGLATSSATVTVTVVEASGGDVPDAPENLVGRSKGLYVNLGWTESATASSYTVFRRLNSEVEFMEVGDSNVSAYVETLPRGTLSAEYIVVAENQFGVSDDSEVVVVHVSSRRRR